MHYTKNLKKILKATTVWSSITDESRISVFTTKNETFVSDTKKALANLRKILRVVTKIASKRGSILIYDPSYHSYEVQGNLTIVNRWPNGYVSNLHSKASFYAKHYPDFVIVLNCTEQHLRSVVYELYKADIPLATIQKDTIPTASYCACLDLNRKPFKRIIFKLIRRAIFQGNLLELYSLKK